MKQPAYIIILLWLACCVQASAQSAPTSSPQTASYSPGRPHENQPQSGWRKLVRGIYLRAGVLLIAPLGRSDEVILSEVDGTARLAIDNGPIEGSYVELSSKLMPAMILGYQLPFLGRRFSLETILGLPFALKMKAGGTLADQSLAPTALGNVPTGIPPLGTELGEVTVLPPVLTAVYRMFAESPVRPYIGAGVSILVPLDAKITNPILTEVAQPRVELAPRWGWVLQAGLDINFYDSFWVVADCKYLGGIDITAHVKDIRVRTPNLPLYETVSVGNNEVRLSANPIVAMLGIGFNL